MSSTFEAASKTFDRDDGVLVALLAINDPMTAKLSATELRSLLEE